jgi:hypothetical protein
MRKPRLVIALLILLQSSAVAHAGIHATTGRNLNISSGTWSAIAVGQNQPSTNSAYTLNWSVSSGTAYNYFVIRNTGSLTIRSASLDISQVQIGGSGRPNDTLFELCQSGLWNPSNNTCSGNIVQIGRASNGNISLTNLNLVTSAELSLRASTATNVKNSYTTTISVSVNRLQALSGAIRNS